MLHDSNRKSRSPKHTHTHTHARVRALLSLCLLGRTSTRESEREREQALWRFASSQCLSLFLHLSPSLCLSLLPCGSTCGSSQRSMLQGKVTTTTTTTIIRQTHTHTCTNANMCEQRWRLCRCRCRRCRSCVLLEAGNIFSSLASNLPNRRILTFVVAVVVVVVVSPCVSLFDDFVSFSSSFASFPRVPLLSRPNKRAQIVKKER